MFSSDAEDSQYVYDWRLEQEAAMRAQKGTGMTDEQVVMFVNGCKMLPVRLAENPLTVLTKTILHMRCIRMC